MKIFSEKSLIIEENTLGLHHQFKINANVINVVSVKIAKIRLFDSVKKK
jgi:hypothetical protein